MADELLCSKLISSKKFPNNDPDFIETEFDQYIINQSLTPQDLEIKASAILSRNNNNPQTEKEFRRICEWYKNQNSVNNPELNEAYEKYIDAYHKITSIYRLWNIENRVTCLHIFDTEKLRNSYIFLDLSELNLSKQLQYGVCILRLPNDELFCFGEWWNLGITFIVGSNYKVRALPRGMPCCYSSAICFNRTIYCFGGYNLSRFTFYSSRFDLDKNKWFKIAQMPIIDKDCSTIIFNGNILISGYKRNILIYSPYTNSFSTIPYDFTENSQKILIKAEMLYLIELKHEPNGLIYENEAGDEYIWKIIGKTINANACHLPYCVYNKGGIFIVSDSQKKEYFKFDLVKNEIMTHKREDLILE